MTFTFSFADKEQYLIEYCELTKAPTSSPTTAPSNSPTLGPSPSLTKYTEEIPLTWTIAPAITSIVLLGWAICCFWEVQNGVIRRKTLSVGNPMVLMVGIGYHADKVPADENEINAKLPDLPGVKEDILNIEEVFGNDGLGYNTYTKRIEETYKEKIEA